MAISALVRRPVTRSGVGTNLPLKNYFPNVRFLMLAQKTRRLRRENFREKIARSAVIGNNFNNGIHYVPL